MINSAATMPSVYAGCPSARHQEAKITLLSPQLLAEKQKAVGRGCQQKAAGKADGEAGRHLAVRALRPGGTAVGFSAALHPPP